MTNMKLKKKKLKVGDRVKSKLPEIDEFGKLYYPTYEIVDISKPSKHKIIIIKNGN